LNWLAIYGRSVSLRQLPGYRRRNRRHFNNTRTVSLDRHMETVERPAASFLSRYRIWLLVLFLVLTTFGVYARVLTHDFNNFDDPVYVTENFMVINGLTIDNIAYAFNINVAKRAYWHPLTWLSHMLDCELFGVNAGWHHLTNLLLHIGNSLLLFLVFHAMTTNFLPSAIMAILFALHPLSVDSAAWIAERKNVLSTFFWLLTMLTYVYYSRQPGPIRYLVVITVFIMGLLAKPMLVTLPCVLLLMDFWPMNRMRLLDMPTAQDRFSGASLVRLILEKVPLLVFSLLSIGLSSYSLRLQGILLSTTYVPMPLRIENAIVSYVKYLSKIVWPQDLAIYYPFPAHIPMWQVAGAALFLIGISYLVVRRLKAAPWLAIGWFWFLGTLFPVSGLVQGGLWPEMADRWAYVPQIGVFLLAAWPVAELLKAPGPFGRLSGILAGGLLVALSVATWIQIGYWKDSKTLFTHALSVTGSNHLAHGNLGHALYTEGRYEEAIKHLQISVQLNPRREVMQLLLAESYQETGQLQPAIPHFVKAIELKPEDLSPYTKLGNILKELADNEGKSMGPAKISKSTAFNPQIHQSVEKALTKVLAEDPQNTELLFNIGSFFGEQHKYSRARGYLEKAATLAPENALVNNNLGIIAFKQGRNKAAEKYLEKALTANPALTDPYKNLGLIYSTSGRPRRGIDMFTKALELIPADKEIRLNLANTLAQVERLPDALDQYAKILEEDPEHEKGRKGYEETNRFLTALDSEIERTSSLLKFDPDSPSLLETLGDLYMNRGSPQQALAYYIEIDPRYRKQPSLINKAAVAYARSENYAKALSYFRQFVMLWPEIPDGYYNVACMYAQLRETDQAVQWLGQALDRGYDRWDKLEIDEDLENIHGTPAYQELLKRR